MFRIRILDRAIFSEMLPAFFLSMSALLLVLFLERLFKLADLIVSKEATLASTAKIFAYIMPGFLVITVPMSLIVASLTTFARLSADSEITAMKASRISLYHMMRPVVFFSLLAFAATSFTSLVLVPRANAALKDHLFSMVKARALVGLEPGVFSTAFDGMVVYVDQIGSLDGLKGIFISDERSAREPFVIVAKRGKLLADQRSMNVTLLMHEGAIHTQPHARQAYSLMGFDAARLNLDISNALAQKNTQGKNYEDLDTLSLIGEIDRMKQEGKPTAALETQLHWRISVPYSCVILGLLGVPLGIRRSRSGKSAGVAIAFLVFLVYYIVLSGATSFAERGTFPALQAFWTPNIAMTAAALLFVFIKVREFHFGLWHRLGMIYYGVFSREKRARRLS